MDYSKLKTLGDLKKSGYSTKSIKDELRDNLIASLQTGTTVFKGILGYEQTVMPQLERAILAKHSINLLGLRGQAKTRIARQMVNLLDEFIPIVTGSELNDDPLAPISRYAIDLLAEKGDKMPITWLHRSMRYAEKLATPDVTVADLIGDVDPIKAANQKLSYADERVIHFGLIPRANRCIFVINELPDLQARIQVSLFNVLQESDIQIRGFNLRLPMDIQFVFTANPEDYTNRGAIITPLKDRIQSQILTHYPQSIALGANITKQEAKLNIKQEKAVTIPDVIRLLIEQVAAEARVSEFVDAKSGVSARLTISALENLVATAERRILINKETKTVARISDLYQLLPAINGKIELVYEGEQEGSASVALRLIIKAIRSLAEHYFPGIEKTKKRKSTHFEAIVAWFGEHTLNLLNECKEQEYRKELDKVNGLAEAVATYYPKLPVAEKYLMMEFLLHGLGEHSLIGIQPIKAGLSFTDLMGNYLNFGGFDTNFEESAN